MHSDRAKSSRPSAQFGSAELSQAERLGCATELSLSGPSTQFAQFDYSPTDHTWKKATYKIISEGEMVIYESELSLCKYIVGTPLDRKSTRLNSSHSQISYAVFCLKKKNKQNHVN